MGSISLLVEDSTVVVLCFAAKRKKISRGIGPRGELKGDDVTMTELEKKNTILSDGFFPPSLTSRKSRFRVSSVCPSGAASRWNCFATGGNLSYRRSSNHGISSVSPVPCKRTPQLPSGIRNTLSIVRGLFLSLDHFIISINQFTHHVALVILEKINKNEWCMNGISQQVLKCRYYIYRIGSIVVVNK